MKLTDQPKDLVKAVQDVIKTSTPAANEKAKEVSEKLSSRYDSMKPIQINEQSPSKRTPEQEKAYQEGMRKFKEMKKAAGDDDETFGLPVELKQPRRLTTPEQKQEAPESPRKKETPAELMKRLNKQVDDMNKQMDSTEQTLKATEKTQAKNKPVATVTPVDRQGRPINKLEPSTKKDPSSLLQKPQYKKFLPTGTDADAAERDQQQAKPVEVPKAKEVNIPDKIEVPKTDASEPKLAELPKMEPIKAKAKETEADQDMKRPMGAEKEKPKAAEPPKMRHFDPFQGAESESGHGFQGNVPYYDKPYEPGMKPAGYTQEPADRTKPQPAPEKEEDDAVTKGVKKAASKLASLFKKKEEPDQDMKRPMGTQKEHVEIEEAAMKLHPMAVHLAAANSTHYHVKAVGKQLAHGLEVGEKLNDTEVDDLKDMGAKIKHIKEERDMSKTSLVVEKMMKKLHGKLDPVGKEDADVDNDGDSDKSDSYLKNRREKIAAAMKEELIGNQHKIDANKNNKIDAHDFELLRKRRKK